jgi:hypothetical protein
MKARDARQTQDDRARERDGGQDAREEYTTYREVDPDQASPDEADARREADLQPAPAREGGDEDSAGKEGGDGP